MSSVTNNSAKHMSEAEQLQAMTIQPGGAPSPTIVHARSKGMLFDKAQKAELRSDGYVTPLDVRLEKLEKQTDKVIRNMVNQLSENGMFCVKDEHNQISMGKVGLGERILRKIASMFSSEYSTASKCRSLSQTAFASLKQETDTTTNSSELKGRIQKLNAFVQQASEDLPKDLVIESFKTQIGILEDNIETLEESNVEISTLKATINSLQHRTKILEINIEEKDTVIGHFKHRITGKVSSRAHANTAHHEYNKKAHADAAMSLSRKVIKS